MSKLSHIGAGVLGAGTVLAGLFLGGMYLAWREGRIEAILRERARKQVAELMFREQVQAMEYSVKQGEGGTYTHTWSPVRTVPIPAKADRQRLRSLAYRLSGQPIRLPMRSRYSVTTYPRLQPAEPMNVEARLVGGVIIGSRAEVRLANRAGTASPWVYPSVGVLHALLGLDRFRDILSGAAPRDTVLTLGEDFAADVMSTLQDAEVLKP